MPQGKRKVPFSGKAKKQQLQMRKSAKSGGKNKPLLVSNLSSDDDERDIQKLNYQPKSSNSRRDLNKYVLQFHKESESELLKRKEEAHQSLNKVEESNLEINLDDYFPEELNFPTRPEWDYSMSKQELEARENRYFSEYIKTLESKFNWKDLSYFELNLETWRQLWRVLEMADIVLIVIDVRYPALMFPPSLYHYVCETMKKHMVVVLNKIDLAPASLVVAWKHYFLSKFPDLHIVCFTSLPGYNIRGNTSNRAGLLNRRRKGRLRMASEGALKLLEACKNIVKDNVDLALWHEKISEEMDSEYEDDGIMIGQTIELTEQDLSYIKPDRYSDGVLTIGCVGQPNVGKSSLMNGLMGKKVVSVSRTPGHTKHFQTIFLTKNVRLCDCPGLIFPSKVPKQLQVLMGSFPIAQLREPYTAIRFLAERLDLIKLLSLEHPDQDETWSAMDIVDGWALKRHFYTARAARLDSYRAANHLLRMALDGRISLCLYPPLYTSSKDTWENHPDVEEVKWIQAKSEEEIKELPVAPSVDNSDESDVSEDSAPSSSRRSVSPNRTDESSDENLHFSSNKFGALNSSNNSP